MTSQKSLIIVSSCFFFTGLSALVCEVCWIRQASLAFGSSTWALSVLLAVFFAGLAGGSYAVGRGSQRLSSPLIGYAWLELGVGLMVAASPLLFQFADSVYAQLYARVYESTWLLALTRITLMSCIMLPATLMMGGSLPLLCQQFVRSHHSVARIVGWLYGINTLGAAMGAATCGFWLIPSWGIRTSLYAAAAINVVVGLIALAVAQYTPFEQVSQTVDNRSDESHRQHGQPVELSASQRATLVVIFFGIGFVAVASEVLWTRFLSLWLPNTVYTYTLTLSVVLMGIVLGSWLASLLVERVVWRAGLLGWTQVAAALAVMFVMQMKPNWWGEWINAIGPGQQLGVVACVMLVPAIFSGLAFPLAISMIVHDVQQTGRQAGRMTAANLSGGIVGSAVAGFVLLPYGGLQWTLFFVTGVGLLLGLVTWWRLERKVPPGVKLLWGIAAISVWVGIPLYQRTLLPRDFLQTEGRLVDYREGFNANVAVIEKAGLRHLEINRMWQGQNLRNHQVFAGHIPALLHQAAGGSTKRVLAIGLGTGQTASSFLKHDIERLDCLEIEDGLVQLVKQHFDGAWLDDPRVRMIVEDGRNFVTHTTERYDLISIEVGQIYRPRISTFYTADFYEQLRPRLQKGGLVCQFLPIEFFGPEEFRTLLNTFQHVFPQCWLWYNTSELLIIGADQAIRFDAQQLGEFVRRKKLQGEFDYAYWGGPAQYLSHRESLLAGCLCGPNQVSRLADGGDIYRDDRPYLEYLPVNQQSSTPKLVEMISRQLTPLALLFDNTVETELAQAQLLRQENLQDIVARGFVVRAQALEKAGDAVGAADNYQAALEASPSNPRANLALAKFLESQGDLSLAMRFYQRVLAIQPDNLQALQRLSDGLFATGQYASAQEQLTHLLELAPQDVSAHVSMGWVLGQQGLNSQAMQHFETALGYDDRAPRALLGAANVWQSLGESDKAVRAYQRLLDIDPRQTEAHIGLAMALQSKGEEDQALQHFQSAVEAFPDNVNVLSSMAWLLATRSDTSKRDFQQAKMLAEKAWHGSQQQSPLAADALAAAYAGLQQFDRANELAELALEAAQRFNLSQLASDIKQRQEHYRQGRMPDTIPKK